MSVQYCPRCLEEFSGPDINIHGSLEFIKHTNVANNISVCIHRAAGDIQKLIDELTLLIAGRYEPGEDVSGVLECLDFHGADEATIARIDTWAKAPRLSREVVKAVAGRLESR